MPTVALGAPDADDPPFRVVSTGTRDEQFAAFMTAAAPQLARTAWLLCGDAHLADELVQLGSPTTSTRTGFSRPPCRAMTESFLDEGPAGPPPVEPTLEMAGCTRWETC